MLRVPFKFSSSCLLMHGQIVEIFELFATVIDTIVGKYHAST